MNTSFSVELNWKTVLAVGGASSMIILTIKANPEDACQLLENAVNACKDCFIAFKKQ